VCGQDQAVAVLKNQVKNDKVSHAYLFCGSRGTGKTTCAKILAKAVNCENPKDGDPCGECPSCRAINSGTTLDVVEIDAASNNGVDSIRQLCEEVKYMPSDLKKRVYIIDEVHMLTIAAFNALLKTLEEPPEHVLFILATTELQKLPATILSRCQRINFRRIPNDVIVDRLMNVASVEGIQIEREAAGVIARLSDGALRDALSLLESCIGKADIITEEEITKLLGLGNRELLIKICRAALTSNAPMCMSALGELYTRQGDIKSSISELFKLYRDLLIIKTVPDPGEYLDCTENEKKELFDIAGGFEGSDRLNYHLDLLRTLISNYDYVTSGKKAYAEVTFLKMCDPAVSDDNGALLARIEALEEKASRASFATAPENALRSESVPERETRAAAAPEKAEKPAEDTHASENARESAAEEKAAEKEPAPKKTAAAASGTAFDRKKLISALGDDAFLGAYLGETNMRVEGRVLTVEAEEFTVELLKTMEADKTLAKAAKSIGCDIDSVTIRAAKTASNNDILDTL